MMYRYFQADTGGEKEKGRRSKRLHKFQTGEKVDAMQDLIFLVVFGVPLPHTGIDNILSEQGGTDSKIHKDVWETVEPLLRSGSTHSNSTRSYNGQVCHL